MKKSVLLFISVFVFISCKQAEAVPDGNNFYFENPQPIDNSDLNNFPNKFQGIYMNSDSIFLKIEKDIILSEHNYKFRFHKSKLDSLSQEFNIVNNKFYLKESNEFFEYKSIGDSIELIDKDIDTVYYFSDFQKAKRINGNLVLNQKDSIYWKVKLLCLNRNVLTIKQLYSDSDLKSLDSITKIHSKMIDSASFIITPKRREFNQLFKLKKFGFDQEYRKISK